MPATKPAQINASKAADLRKRIVSQSDFPQSPTWLLSSRESDEWIVTDAGDKPNCTIRFNVRLPANKTMKDYPSLYRTIRDITFGIRSGPMATLVTGTVQNATAKHLITLARWMIANCIERFSDLKLEDIRNYTRVAAGGVHAVLETEIVLARYVEEAVQHAEFSPLDSDHERRTKAMRVFPYYYVKDHGSRPRLARTRLLDDAGLGDVSRGNMPMAAKRLMTLVEDECRFDKRSAPSQQPKQLVNTDDPENETVTSAHLHRVIGVFDLLYRHRRYVIDAIHFDPFPLTSAAREAARLGRATGRTPTIPVSQAMTFVERSCRWVINYAPLLLAFKDDRDRLHDQNASKKSISRLYDQAWPETDPTSPFPIVPTSMTNSRDDYDEVREAVGLREGMSLQCAINFLITACAVVIAAFSARRAAEIIGLKAGCVTKDENGDHWMRIFIHKTLMYQTDIPVPRLVAEAVTILERISKRARLATNTEYLFQFDLSGYDSPIGLGRDRVPVFNLNLNMRKFGFFVDVPDLPDGTRWAFRPHQFRRFFAILYIWIYRPGNLGALSNYLRHDDLEMTRRYVTDSELGAILRIADREHTAEILANAAFGKEHISGEAGNRLKQAADKIYSRLSNRVNIVTESKFADRIMRFVERGNLSLRALPWGYCAAREESASRIFSCSSSGGGPSIEKATVGACAGCAFSVRTEAFSHLALNTITQHRRIAFSPNTPEILRQASEKICADLERHIENDVYVDKKGRGKA